MFKLHSKKITASPFQSHIQLDKDRRAMLNLKMIKKT